MREAELIARTAAPLTRTALAERLRDLGVVAGDTVIVHTALSALGWVIGDAVAVIAALRDALGDQGTLVMPAHSGQLTDPAHWQAPPVPEAWIETIRAEMPAYDPATTPSRGMGRVAELFRTWPGVLRSDHPACSFCALGPAARAIVSDHALESPLGERSPLAALYAQDARIVLLGVGFDRCTMLHLAEDRAWPERPKKRQGAPLTIAGRRQWVPYMELPPVDGDHFSQIGEVLAAEGAVATRSIGLANAHLVSARHAVDRAVEIWRDTALSEPS